MPQNLGACHGHAQIKACIPHLSTPAAVAELQSRALRRATSGAMEATICREHINLAMRACKEQVQSSRVLITCLHTPAGTEQTAEASHAACKAVSL